MKKEKNGDISVDELLREHMKFLAVRATFSKEDYGPERSPEDKGDIIMAMENLQCLMNRLNVSEPKDPFLSELAENRVFFGLSYDSKLLAMEHATGMSSLRCSIDRLIDVLENDPKLRDKMRRSVGWRLFRLFSRLPWGR
jgi:hypothetical protein